MKTSARQREAQRRESAPGNAVLQGLLGELGSSIDRMLGQAGSGHLGERSKTYTFGLVILRTIHSLQPSLLEPSLDARAPLGHSCPELDQLVGLEPGGSLEILEELADLGLLQRQLFNLIHTCPQCQKGLVNLRQVCPACSAIDLSVERVLHHFACAWMGLESEFTQGFSLRCPKCQRELHQLGQDFERPNETYVCNECSHTCEDPALEAQCLSCGNIVPSSDLELVRIHSYRPTQLATRAIELGRLTGLDLAELMVDADLKLDARDFLVLEARREVARLARNGGVLSAARLWFEADGQPYEIFRRWSNLDRAQLGQVLATLRAPLDLVARMDACSLGVLLPGADAAGAEIVRQRLFAALGELQLCAESGRALKPCWQAAAWSDPSTSAAQVLSFLGLEASSE